MFKRTILVITIIISMFLVGCMETKEVATEVYSTIIDIQYDSTTSMIGNTPFISDSYYVYLRYNDKMYKVEDYVLYQKIKSGELKIGNEIKMYYVKVYDTDNNYLREYLEFTKTK